MPEREGTFEDIARPVIPVRAAILANSREALIASVLPSGVSFQFGGQSKPPDLFIAMPCCGEVRAYMSLDWVPDHDVQCSCGNYFIKYKKED